MSADFFITDGPRVVPAEYQAWQAAHDYWYACVQRALHYEGWDGTESERLSSLAIAAKGEADCLEQIARAAFRRACA
ncbi:hypothetical protein [Comamonas testosteroni]|uniref:hypothetical protein n=1 Tax=Comamonas testosteroni TaxID=285 RepID=UPI0006B88B12|nr:hypothetical protein [Comamonas testosteroni]